MPQPIYSLERSQGLGDSRSRVGNPASPQPQTCRQVAAVRTDLELCKTQKDAEQHFMKEALGQGTPKAFRSSLSLLNSHICF